MSRILSDEDILWVNDFLLRRKDVGRELPTLISLTVLQDKNFDRIRNILRLKLPTTPSATQNDRIDIMGYVAARLYRVGTLLDRPDFVEVAVQQADKCFSAVTPSSVNRFYGRSEAGAGWLGTYLGVVDVALADYIYSGRPSSLDLAKQVYGLVTDRFGVPGTSFLGCEENNISVPLTANLPQVVDIEGESPSAMAIRLGFALNVLESDPARRETGTMQISGVSGSFAPLLSQAGSIVAGYYTVAKCAIDPKGILVVGGDVERRVQQFCRKYPTSWVFPVVGDLRPDWKLRQNNVYEFQGSQIVGDALAKPTPNLP